MVRAPCIDKNGMKKGAWSEEEDDKLRAYVLRYGHWNWRLVPKFAGLNRCGKSCRLRWMNYLKPGVKRGGFAKEERELVKKLHDQFGNKWSAIAAMLPGRTDNEIKNYWHTHFDNKRSRRSGGNKPGQLQTNIFTIDTASSWMINSPNTSETLQSGIKQEKSEASSSEHVYILESSSNSGVSEASGDDWDLDSFIEQICSAMQSEPSDSFGMDDNSANSSLDAFPGFIQESFVVDTSYIQEFDFPLLFDDSAGIYYNHSLGFDDDNDMKLFQL